MMMTTTAATNSVGPREAAPPIDAVLVIDKPIGPTSFDVVRRVRRAARIKRVGHGGTLDPAASGVLPICLGEATKVSQFLLDADKEYAFTVCFGVETDTDDAAGTITARRDAGAVVEADVRRAMAAFRGPIAQVPPSYSALKRAGRPLYEYARAGEAIEIAARNVVVHELEMISFAGPDAVAFTMRCSKGTYVRALARDLGRALDVGAHVTALRRTRSGPFSLVEARPLDEVLAALADGASVLPLVPPADALRHLEQRIVPDQVAADVRMGRRIVLEVGEGQTGQSGTKPADRRVCLLDGRGKLVAVAQHRPDRTVELLRVFRS